MAARDSRWYLALSSRAIPKLALSIPSPAVADVISSDTAAPSTFCTNGFPREIVTILITDSASKRRIWGLANVHHVVIPLLTLCASSPAFTGTSGGRTA